MTLQVTFESVWSQYRKSLWGHFRCFGVWGSLAGNADHKSNLCFVKPVFCNTDLSLCRFREGISFPNFFGEVHPETAHLQALCCALGSTEQSTFRGGEKGEKVPREGEEEGWPAKGAKRKKGRAKTGRNIASHIPWSAILLRK